MQNVPASYCVASDHGHHRFWQAPDLLLQVQYVEPGNTIPSHISSFAAHFLIASRTEGLLSFAAKDHHSHFLIFMSKFESMQKLLHGQRPKGVAHLGTVDGHLGDLSVFALFIANIFKFSCGSPVHAEIMPPPRRSATIDWRCPASARHSL